MIMSLVQLLQDNLSPSEEEARHAIAGNICRCTGYQNIVTSALHAAGKLRELEERVSP
jgi:carbon-monoxide dehydrogenase small subunit